VLFVGLDMQDTTSDARDFLRRHRLDYLNVRDPSNDVSRRYGVTGVPETFFVSRSGHVVAHVTGTITPGQLRDGVKAAVLGRPQAAHRGGARKPTR